MHQAELPDGSPVWVVTGWQAVTSLLADPRMSASKSDSTTGFRGQNLPAALDQNLLNIDGERHRRVRKLAAAFAVIIGGFENVTSLTSAVLDELVRNHGETARRLLGAPQEFAGLVREVMGVVAPVNYALRRFPLTDIEVNGVTIPRGHTVLLFLRSAHLDPARREGRDLVFGHGRHFCIGAALAERQAVQVARAVLEKYPRLEPVKPCEEYRLRPSWLTYACAELPLRAM